MSAMANLTLTGLQKSFRGTTALADVDLDVKPGEIVTVFGPSGAGKTVLLRLVAGIDQPDKGAIVIGGEDVTAFSPDRRSVGMAFQNFALFPHMSAFANIASPLEARGASRSAVADRVKAVARLLRIEHVLDHAPRELSNGQKQRTALARALAAEPSVLLLDDPLRNVDARLRYEMRMELPRLLRESGATVLYVTQDFREAMALGDRIAVLIGGRLVQIGPPEEIYERPASVAAARLFGDPTINLIPVEPTVNGTGLSVSIANARMPLKARYEGAAGRPCLLGIRPEAIRLSAESGPETLPVEIVAVTPLHERQVTLLHTADGAELFASEPASGNGAPIIGKGRVYASFDSAKALLFDRESGIRLETS